MHPVIGLNFQDSKVQRLRVFGNGEYCILSILKIVFTLPRIQFDENQKTCSKSHPESEMKISDFRIQKLATVSIFRI